MWHMNREERAFLEEFRRNEATPIENNLIDELGDGEIDRSEFLRRGAMFGLSASVIGAVLGRAGTAFASPAAAHAAKAGGTVRVGIATWGGSLEPYKLAEAGTLGITGIPGEFLTFSDPHLRIQPWLATSWKSNKDATVWTFQLRENVKFHNGATMTADDVVAAFKTYAGNKSSQALSAFQGVLNADGVVKKGPHTVEFHLEAPTGSFPYLVSNTTYQTIIYPKSIPLDHWVDHGMISTGPFKLSHKIDKREYDFVRNPHYWGGAVALDGVKAVVFQSSTAQALAMRAGQIDIPAAISPQEAQPFMHNSKWQIITQNTPAHREFTLRTDGQGAAGLNDARVRRAIALVINRPEVINNLLLGAATVGNDTPFWKGYPSSDPSVQQRKQNIQLAQALLKAAGQQNLKFTITTHQLQEIPDYAAAIQRYGKEAGMDISINLESDDQYYGGSNATTPWLNADATITEWGTRAVPNVYLTAAFASNGVWNAPHFKSAKVDSAIKSYLAAPDIKSQRKYSKQISGILLEETPTIIAYHFSTRTPINAKLRNYQPEGISHVFIKANTSFS
jgi:peptide/nickel transport system substrate-binding protein